MTDEHTPATLGSPVLTRTGKWLLPVPTAAAIVAIAIALLAAVGWWQGIEILRSGAPGMPPMRVPGILLIVLIGVGLLLTGTGPHGWRRFLAAVCAAAVMATALGFILGSDERAIGPTIAGALVFLALGLALGLMQVPRPPVITVAALSVFAAVLPLYRLVEYLIAFATDGIQPGGPFTAMAFNGALALCLLAGPALFLHPRLPLAQRMFADDESSRLLRLALPWGTVGPVILAVAIEYAMKVHGGGIEFPLVAALALFSALASAAFWRGHERLQTAERAMRHSEARLDTVLQTLPALVWMKDSNGVYLTCNRKFERLLGHAASEIVGHKDTDFFPAELAEHFRAHDRAAIEAGGPRINEESVTYADDGHREELETIKTPVHSPDGALIGVLGIAHDITERKRAAQVLAENEGVTRAIMDSLPHAIAVLDGDGTILHVNESWRSFAADNAADAPTRAGIGLNYLDTCRQARNDVFAREVLTGLEDILADRSESFALEYPCHSPDRRRWFAMRANPLRTGMKGLVVSHIDITERKLAELDVEQDRQQQSALRQMLETILRGDSLEETLGRCLDQLLAVPWLAILPRGGIFLASDEDDHLHLTVARGLADGVTSQCGKLPSGRCLCGKAAATGELVFAGHVDARHEVTYSDIADHGHYCVPLLGSRRETIGVLALYLPAGSRRDPAHEEFLTSVAGALAGFVLRQRVDEALARSETLLERAQALAHIGSWHADFAAGTYVGSIETYRIFDLPPEPAAWKSVFAKVHPEDLPALLVSRHAALAGEISDVDFRILTTSGIKWIRSKGEPVHDKDGHVTGAAGMVQDITGERAAQEALRQHQEQLEELVAQRTRELTAERDKAERLSRVKGEFLANMSHEIRTPLNAVLGFARIGMRENRGRKSGETCHRIFEAGEHLLGVINDVLDFSKIEAGRLYVESRPLPLRSVLDHLYSFFTDAAETKGLALRITAADSLPDWVLGDKLRLKQILVNLVGNAIKFTDHGEVSLTASHGDGDTIAFRVADTGIGMAPEQLDRLFIPFEQADGSTTRRFGGTGLGLSISSKLAELMGGRIEVASTRGEGSVFTLIVPLPETNAVDEPPELPRSGRARLAGLRILVAEDVEVNRMVLADLMENEGAELVFAENGQLALDCVATEGAHAFDLVLMDIQMPVMDGFEATQRLHQLAPDLPVIGLTAHALAEERDKCLAAGMVEHITKPVDLDILVNAIRHHVAGHVPLTPAGGPATAKSASPIDWQALETRYGGRADFIDKLLATVLKSHAQTAASLRAAADRDDQEAMAFLGHSLKGMAGNIEARALQELAHRLQDSARAGAGDSAALARRLADQLDALMTRLRQRPDDRPQP